MAFILGLATYTDASMGGMIIGLKGHIFWLPYTVLSNLFAIGGSDKIYRRMH